MLRTTTKLLIIGGLASMTYYALANDLTPREQAIEQRLTPFAQVNVGSGTTDGQAAVTQAAADDDDDAAFYNGLPCSACHATGAAGAPIVGNADDWAPRIADAQTTAEEQGIDYVDVLTQIAINGLGAMPPRGTCSNCSDEDIHRAVEYMVSQSQ